VTEPKERLYHFLVFRQTLVAGLLLVIISCTQDIKRTPVVYESETWSVTLDGPVRVGVTVGGIIA
jgi:hypothetical protein